MKVALVHEFLTQLGGAERVLQAFHEIFPNAPVYTLVYDEQKTELRFKNYDLRISFLQRFYRRFKSYKWLLPLMPHATESFDLSDFDLVISDSSAFAKGIRIKKPTVHICYCHTPTRYLWEDMESYVSDIKYHGVVKFFAMLYLKCFLRKWDYRAAQQPDYFIANSKTVRERIKKYYDRDSTVIYPPVDTEFFRPLSAQGGPREGSGEVEPRQYFFTASRLEPYKKIDLVIEAFDHLEWPLKVAGSGTELEKLKIIPLMSGQKSNIEFLGRVSDEELRELYRGAKAFIFPALEDAGIMILEALACGTPVIGLGQGGVAEFIKDGENGILMTSQTVDEIFAAVKKLSISRFDPQQLRESALPFDKEVFKKKLLELVKDLVKSS